MKPQSPPPQPAFDPARSDAIRTLLMQQVTAGGRRHRHPSTRTIVLGGLALLAALVAGGTTAYALTGGELFGAPAPEVSTPAATPTPTPSATPTPTPTPTPISPPENPPAPVVRVPATCDQLLPQSLAESLTGAPLTQGTTGQFSNPLFYSDLRAGSLDCIWTDSATGTWNYESNLSEVTVIPDVSAEAFTTEAERENGYITSPESSIGENTFSSCGSGDHCGFISLVNGYAVHLSASVPSELDAERRDEVRAAFIALRDQVAALGSPAPLWQPDGATLAGASTCDGLMDSGTLASLLGVAEVSTYKSEGGEYANSTFGTAATVNAHWCSWIDGGSGSTYAFAAVLPGGASYFAESAAAEPDKGWQPTIDYPGEAYITADGTKVSVLIDGGWVEVQAPAEVLHAVTDVVLANVGAAPAVGG